MTIKAKPILDNKFWIVEDAGVKVGTLSKEEDNTFVVTGKGKVEYYTNENALKNKFGKQFFTAKITTVGDEKEKNVHGFPTKVTPYNSMYDINQKLPLFTKSEKSSSVYCAGYYLIKFNVNWLKSFCPKLITLERNEYKGPFKTDVEMKAALKLCK
jgi:hypothetical protein